MIKAFIFDWGNVLHLIDNEGFIQEIASLYSIDANRLSKVETELRKKLDGGEIDAGQYISKIGDSFGVQIDKDKYYDTFFSKYVTLNRKLLDIIIKIKHRYKLIILSNNNPPFFDFMKRNTDFENIFDKIVVSFKEKLKKPDSRFFRKAIEGLNINFDECIYVDDEFRFAKEAKKLGMKSIVFTNVEDFEKELANLGISIS